MSPVQPSTIIEVTTRDREHLSGILFRTLGFVNTDVLRDTLERNPHLVGMPFLYPAQTVIQIDTGAREESEIPVQALWS